MRILFCGNTFPDAPEYLREHLHPGANDEIIVCPDENIVPHLAGVDVVIPKMQRIGVEVIPAGTFRLVHQWGAGLEGVDVDGARRKGVFVANVPATGGNAESVAEHAMLLTLALLRGLPKAQTHVGKGVLGAQLGKVLAGQTVRLYGLGAIALPLLRAFDLNLIGISRQVTAEKIAQFHLPRCVRHGESLVPLVDGKALRCLRLSSHLFTWHSHPNA